MIHILSVLLMLTVSNEEIKINQQEQLQTIHKERIDQLINVVNNKSNPNIEDFFLLFFVNSELEKRLYINKKIKEGINEEIADSLFDWVIMENREINESLVLLELKKKLSPISNYYISKIFVLKNAYTIYEVNLSLNTNEGKFFRYHFQISNLKEEMYPIIDIYDEKLKSIITESSIGHCQ